MRLIIGGASQGKLRYAKEFYNINDADIWTCEASGAAKLPRARVIDGLHRLVRMMLEDGKDMDDIRDMLAPEAMRPDVIIICDEVGLGVVPVDTFERAYRDAVGRICCELAETAESVERIYFGIATRIK